MESKRRDEGKIKRAEETEAKAVRTVELWRSFPKFAALAQDAHVVALKEVVKHIDREIPGFHMAFLEEAVEEQKNQLQRLIHEAGVLLLMRMLLLFLKMLSRLDRPPSP